MKRRLPRAVIIAYLAMITAIAPVAFRIGYANSANRTALSQNDTDSDTGMISPYDGLQTSRDGCGLLGQPGTIRRTGIELDCLVRPDGQSSAPPPRKVFAGLTQNRRQTPLDTVFASAIAGDVAGGVGGGPTGDGKISNPLSLALAPTAGAQGGSRLGGPTAPSSGGLPYIFAPIIGLANNDSPDGSTPNTKTKSGPNDGPDSPPIDDIPDIFNQPGPDDIPNLVTPIPAALPLLLSGLAGLMAATRRKHRKSSHT